MVEARVGAVVHGRTVVDATERNLWWRVDGWMSTGREAAEMASPQVGAVLEQPDRTRFLVLERRVEHWDAERVDAQTLAPDGEPEPGWLALLTGVLVEPTAEEIVEDEAAAAERETLRRRARLDQRLGEEVRNAADQEFPDADDPALGRVWELPRVPTGGVRVAGGLHRDVLAVDRSTETIWLVVYNVADGDDWSGNNLPGYRVCRMPYTERRRRLVAELRGEYELQEWAERGVSAQAAAVLAAAGWSAASPPMLLSPFRIETADDARALVSRAPQQWEQAGWQHPLVAWGSARFAPADAARLADAGIPHQQASGLAASGHDGVDAIVAARPPAVPDDASCLVIRARRPTGLSHGRYLSTDPGTVRAYLEQYPELWDAEIDAEDAIVVHAEPRWALIGDARVLVADWIGLWLDNPLRDRVPTRPTGLDPAAVHGIDLLVRARNGHTLHSDQALVRRLRGATTHRATPVEEHSSRDGGWSTRCALVRHDYGTAEGAQMSLWLIDYLAGGLVGGEGDTDEFRLVHTAESQARNAWRDAANNRSS